MGMYYSVRVACLKCGAYRTFLPGLITWLFYMMGNLKAVFAYYIFCRHFNKIAKSPVDREYPEIPVYHNKSFSDTFKDVLYKLLCLPA